MYTTGVVLLVAVLSPRSTALTSRFASWRRVSLRIWPAMLASGDVTVGLRYCTGGSPGQEPVGINDQTPRWAVELCP